MYQWGATGNSVTIEAVADAVAYVRLIIQQTLFNSNTRTFFVVRGHYWPELRAWGLGIPFVHCEKAIERYRFLNFFRLDLWRTGPDRRNMTVETFRIASMQSAMMHKPCFSNEEFLRIKPLAVVQIYLAHQNYRPELLNKDREIVSVRRSPLQMSNRVWPRGRLCIAHVFMYCNIV